MTVQRVIDQRTSAPAVTTGKRRLRRLTSGRTVRRICALSWLWFILVAIYAPIVVVIEASFDGGEFVSTRAFLYFPPRNMTFHWYLNVHPRLWQALWVSVSMASISCAFGLLLGIPAALGLVRSNLPGKIVLGTLFRMPLQIPFIVIGVAFL